MDQPSVDPNAMTEMHSARLRATRWVVAIAVVAAALLLRLGLDATTDRYEPPFLAFFAAITVSAWFGGWRPGLLTVALSGLTVTYFFVWPKYSLWIEDPNELVRLSEFLIEGVLICVLAGGLHNALRKADDNARRLAHALEDSRVTVRELVRTRDALRAGESRLRRLVDANIIGVVIGDGDGRLLQANDAFLRMVHYDRADLEAGRMTWGEMTPPEFVDADQQARLELKREGRCVPYEKELICKGGGRVPALVGAATIEESDGSLRTICFALDLTEQKETERELEKSKESAEEANRIKSEFLANTSHELRTPMNSIIGMTDLALEEDIPDEVRDHLETARRSADVLMRLLNDILDFSRIEAGRVLLDSRPFSLRNMADETMKAFSVDASEQGIELAYHVDPDVPQRLLGDEVRLRQVLGNLVSNAVKFTEQGEVSVQISVESQTSDEVSLHFAVDDTGIGIPREQQQRIFAPFTQGDASSTRRYGGTGLGLAIASEFVAIMGGRMWVDSEPGEGSCFHFTARFGRLPEEAPSRLESEQIELLRNLNVLIVDDNETSRDILVETLAGWEMNPVAVETAADALDQLQAAAERDQPFRVVMIDAVMPEVDGFTLAERISGNGQKLTDAVVLMLSVADRQRFANRGRAVEVASYLEKPISPSDLLAALMEAVSGPSRQPVRSKSNLSAPAPSSLHVLLAEDTPANQKVVQAILQKRGHRVAVAPNGREAIALFRQSNFDAVLMDVQMPVLDGLQAAASIRSLERSTSERVPIVALTAHAMRGDRERCLAAGMDAYLAKPIDAHKLIELVESLVYRKPRGANGRRKRTPSGAVEQAVQTPPVATLSADTKEGTLMNVDAALQRMGGSMSLFQDTARFFHEDAPQLLETIRTGLAAGDAAQVERAAHSLKGLAANFDAHDARATAQRLELLAHQQNLADEAQATFEALQHEVDRLEEALAPYRE